MAALLAGCLTEAEPREPTGAENTPIAITTDTPPVVELGDRWADATAIELLLWHDAARVGDHGAVHARHEVAPGATAVVPIVDLEDRSSYVLEARALDGEGAVFERRRFAVDVRLGLPTPTATVERIDTIGYRPAVSWTVTTGSSLVAGFTAADGRTAEVDSPPDRPVVPPLDLFDAASFAAGAGATVRARVRSPNGVLGPWSAPLPIVANPNLVPEVVTAPSGAVVVAEPAFAWVALAGATEYEIEVGAIERTVTDSPWRLESRVFTAATGDLPDTPIDWRMRALGSDGHVGPWTEPVRIRRARSMPWFVPIVEPGAPATFRLGSERGEPDELPAVTVTLTRGYLLAVEELSVELVVALVNHGLDTGVLQLTETEVRHRRWDRSLLGIGDLNLGVQFGMQRSPAAESGTSSGPSIRPVAGYAEHPAVGISWYGAIWIANEVSRREAREPVYRFADDTRTLVANLDADGYRLPTEAEWAFAAAGVTPNPATTNYLRSGDRFEDPLPPFTAAGGPTTPTGTLDAQNARGMRDIVGNVWEWCHDWYTVDAYAQLTPGYADPSGPATPARDEYGRVLKVVRGGAWNTPQDVLRVGDRGAFAPEGTSYSVGLRLARTLPGSD